VSLTHTDAERLHECLAGDGIAVIPTDTVYGLACNPDSEAAIRRLYQLKGRSQRKPAAVMFFALDPALDALPELGERTRGAMRALLPGPVTLLLDNPRARFPLACDPLGEREPTVLGLRVPRFDGSLAPLANVGVPAMQSSANPSGGPDPSSLGDVAAPLREGVDLLLDGGTLAGSASTVIDLRGYERDGTWGIVREGPLGEAAIAEALAHLLAS
jgi:L-threonylcarbamoyladenylate synthase